MDDLLSKRYWFQAGVYKNLDACGDGRGEAEIVRSGHTVYHDASLVSPRHCSDDGAVVGDHRLAGEITVSRTVIEPTDQSVSALRSR